MSKERLHRFQLPIITTSNQHHNPMNIFFMIAHVICHGSFFSSSNMETVQVGFLKNDPSTPRICQSIFIVCYFNINIIFEIFRIQDFISLTFVFLRLFQSNQSPITELPLNRLAICKTKIRSLFSMKLLSIYFHSSNGFHNSSLWIQRAPNGFKGLHLARTTSSPFMLSVLHHHYKEFCNLHLHQDTCGQYSHGFNHTSCFL